MWEVLHNALLHTLPVGSTTVLHVLVHSCDLVAIYTAWWQKNSYPTKKKLIQKLIHGFDFFCHQAVGMLRRGILLTRISELFRSAGWYFIYFFALNVTFLTFPHAFTVSTVSHWAWVVFYDTA